MKEAVSYQHSAISFLPVGSCLADALRDGSRQKRSGQEVREAMGSNELHPVADR
jgi:hypothetical protein